MTRYDMVVVGAGPAGMAAAVEARRAGLSVLVLDEQGAPGGQIYRAVEAADEARHRILGPDYRKGADLAAAFRASGAVYRPGSTVWNISADRVVDFTSAGRSARAEAGALVLATGAIARPTPLPGWLTPGVVSAGAMQILLKANGIAAGETVFVGAGPLLWLVASQMVAAGVPPRAVVETIPRHRYLRAAAALPGAFAARGTLAKGLAMMRRVRGAGVPVVWGAREVAIEGETHVEAVSFAAGRRRRRIETGRVALHHGVVPNPQATRLLGCDHRWDEGQHAFVPVLDENGETSLEGVFVAGDGGGISGAAAAALTGRLAAMAIAGRQGRAVEGRDRVRRALARDRAARPFLETLYAPTPDILAPADATIVCRCEEVTAGEIRAAARLGATGPNQVKAFLRSGMGPCQGRMCGLTVAGLIAATREESLDAVGYYRIRPPLKPLTIGELAAFDEDLRETV